jgi:hypothetical protein
MLPQKRCQGKMCNKTGCCCNGCDMHHHALKCAPQKETPRGLNQMPLRKLTLHSKG